MVYVYLFRCRDKTLYCGVTNNLLKRERLHNLGKGAKYVRAKGGGQMVFWEEYPTRELALKRELQIKKLNKRQKEQLIKGFV